MLKKLWRSKAIDKWMRQNKKELKEARVLLGEHDFFESLANDGAMPYVVRRTVGERVAKCYRDWLMVNRADEFGLPQDYL